MLRSALLLPIGIGLVALTGCAVGDDGPRVSQTRHVDAFTRIDNRDSADVRLHVGERRRVRVKAGSKVIDDVGTEVRDGTLFVTFDRDGFLTEDVVVEAWVPKLDGVAASGSGDIDAAGIDADAFEVRSDGSADIALRGRAAQLAIDIDGSGDARLSGLEAHAARVTVGGSGDVDVRADERLDVKVDGSGDVRYRGNPALTKAIDGSGDLRHAS